MATYTAEFSLGTAVANSGTVTLAYPVGTTQTDFTGGNASATGVAIINENDVYQESAAEISLTYGASDITLTNLSGQTWPAGSKVRAGLAYLGAVLAQFGITATQDELNKAADLTARKRTVVATADGLTTGVLTTADRFITVTSANANNIVKLPAAGADFIGLQISGWIGANGFEMRCDGTGCKINNLDCKTVNEAALAATGWFVAKLVEADSWILEYQTELGADATIVPDAV